MQLFSGRGKEHKQRGEGRNRDKCQSAATTKEETAQQQHRCGGKCRALCCGASRLSVSSSTSCSSADAAPREPAPRGLSKLAHGMVQERLQSIMVDGAAAEAGRHSGHQELAERRRRPPCARGGRYESSGRRRTCVVLLAEDRRTHDPREEFRRSIAEVIAAKRMAELRALLDCYISVNAREHRAAILEAFHEVCSGLFSCKQLC
jgi:uncharacterized protein (TIGR01568 family)